jgi:hypothetical protein
MTRAVGFFEDEDGFSNTSSGVGQARMRVRDGMVHDGSMHTIHSSCIDDRDSASA